MVVIKTFIHLWKQNASVLYEQIIMCLFFYYEALVVGTRFFNWKIFPFILFCYSCDNIKDKSFEMNYESDIKTL